MRESQHATVLRVFGPALDVRIWIDAGIFMMWEQWRQWLEETFVLPRAIYGNSLERIAVAIGIFITALLVYGLIRLILLRRARRAAEQQPVDGPSVLEALVRSTSSLLLLVLALYVASLLLMLPEQAATVRHVIAVIALLIQGAIWGNVLIGFAVTRYAKRRLEHDASTYTTVTAIGFLGKIALWSIALLLILANLNVDVTALVAGLGVGGIAVALAAQNILGDLFASLSIVLDKPFVLGDFIIVGDHLGTVENIGLKTTRLRSLSGEQLIFSNNDLLQSRIRNFKRMYERRILFGFGVTYQTPRDQLKAIPGMVRQIIEAIEQTRFDRAHFKEYGAYALNFEVVYFVRSPDHALYMDIQQQINLALHEAFEREQIEFAFPTQMLFVQRMESVSAGGGSG
jgi:small-conductance mechanosensitive channel